MSFSEKFDNREGVEKERNVERPLKDHERLAKILSEVSKELNREVEEAYGLSDFIETDGSVRMASFGQSEGGIYADEEVKHDQEELRELELGFCGASDPKVAAFYAKVRNCTTPAEIIENWKKEKKKSKSGMFEDAVQIMLHKFFSDRFLVVHSAPYDDYKAGVDNLIINKETGDVIGAFDEVHDSNDGAYTAKKMEKLKKIASRGGASIRYGLTIAEGQLRQARLEKVPVFAISLSAEKFKNLLPAILDGGLSEKSAEEKAFLQALLISWREQSEQIEPLARSEKMKANLERFKAYLGEMGEML